MTASVLIVPFILFSVFGEWWLHKNYHPPFRPMDGGYEEYMGAFEALPYLIVAAPGIIGIVWAIPIVDRWLF